MAHWVIYGTELEELDDKTSSFVYTIFGPIVLILLMLYPISYRPIG